MDQDWEVPNKLVLARRARGVKQNAWKKERLNKCRRGRRAEEKGVLGHVKTCHHSARTP
jgi:hypothetical protein